MLEIVADTEIEEIEGLETVTVFVEVLVLNKVVDIDTEGREDGETSFPGGSV